MKGECDDKYEDRLFSKLLICKQNSYSSEQRPILGILDNNNGFYNNIADGADPVSVQTFAVNQAAKAVLYEMRDLEKWNHIVKVVNPQDTNRIQIYRINDLDKNGVGLFSIIMSEMSVIKEGIASDDVNMVSRSS